jgi:hypothetical protein
MLDFKCNPLFSYLAAHQASLYTLFCPTHLLFSPVLPGGTDPLHAGTRPGVYPHG